MRTFRGESHQKVDSKGRVSIPALFRRVIDAGDPDRGASERATLIIVYGTEAQKRFDCYTVKGIEAVDRRISRMKKGSDERKILERIYQGHSMDTQLDDEGRILLPAKLRERLGLDERAFFIAAGDHFEIWKPETYEAEEMSRVDAWLARQEPDFDPSVLLPDED